MNARMCFLMLVSVESLTRSIYGYNPGLLLELKSLCKSSHFLLWRSHNIYLIEGNVKPEVEWGIAFQWCQFPAAQGKCQRLHVAFPTFFIVVVPTSKHQDLLSIPFSPFLSLQFLPAAPTAHNRQSKNLFLFRIHPCFYPNTGKFTMPWTKLRQDFLRELRIFILQLFM